MSDHVSATPARPAMKLKTRKLRSIKLYAVMTADGRIIMEPPGTPPYYVALWRPCLCLSLECARAKRDDCQEHLKARLAVRAVTFREAR